MRGERSTSILKRGWAILKLLQNKKLASFVEGEEERKERWRLREVAGEERGGRGERRSLRGVTQRRAAAATADISRASLPRWGFIREPVGGAAAASSGYCPFGQVGIRNWQGAATWLCWSSHAWRSPFLEGSGLWITTGSVLWGQLKPARFMCVSHTHTIREPITH